MTEIENSKDLISVLWSGADILRSKMDANEYKDYLLGIVFYKYLSDSFLIKVYDLLYDEKPSTLKDAVEAYKEALNDEESSEELKKQLAEECHYMMEPELTYTHFAEEARNNSFNREQLQKGFNNIEQSDPIFADLFADIDLYSNRLGTGDQKQSDTVASLIKEIDKADLLNSDAEILGNAYEYLIGQFASETGKKAGEFYTPQAVSKILTRIAISGQEDKIGLSVYDPCMGSGSLLLNAKKYAAKPKYNIVPPNSFAYNPARINVGSIGYYTGTENVIVSSLYEVFQTADYVDDRFLWHWFKSEHFPKWIERLQEGSVRLYFYYDKLIQCEMKMPSLGEQKKIGAYFDSLDHLITLHQRELENLQNIKKFMLEKMFV